jgi:acid phosphatase
VYEAGKEPLNGNCGLGELTPKGISQHNQLGAMFRDLYVDQIGFMPQELNPDHLYIRAGDEERLLHSAQAQLRGLYPPASSSQSEVVEMVVRDSLWDNMTPNTNSCPALAALGR